MLYGIKLTSSYVLRWSLHLRESDPSPHNPIESPTLCYSCSLLLGILAPPANTGPLLHLSEPTLSLSLDTETPPVGQWQRAGQEKPKKIKSDLCPPWSTSTNSSKSPHRILFSNNMGFKHVFEPTLSPRNPMQNRVVWVLQMGWRDWLWELATDWAEEITCFQLVQDGCQAWTGENAILGPGGGKVLVLSSWDHTPADNLQGSEQKSDSRNLCQAFIKKTWDGKNKRLKR